AGCQAPWMNPPGRQGGATATALLQAALLPAGLDGNPKVVRERNAAIVDQTPTLMTRQQVLDLYFMDARFKLIELAAFLDRVDRAEGQADFRLDAFRQALRELDGNKPERARQVLL